MSAFQTKPHDKPNEQPDAQCNANNNADHRSFSDATGADSALSKGWVCCGSWWRAYYGLDLARHGGDNRDRFRCNRGCGRRWVRGRRCDERTRLSLRGTHVSTVQPQKSLSQNHLSNTEDAVEEIEKPIQR